MRILIAQAKKLKFILLILAATLFFTSYVMAETDSVSSDIDSPQLNAEEPANAAIPEAEDVPEMQALSGSEMMALSGTSEPELPAISPSAIGGAFSSLMSESFKTDLATGAATLSISIVVPPGRKNVQPNLALNYSSNNPNGICGVGWGLPISAIQRSTKNGVPRYDSIDNFVAGGEELVKIKEEGDKYEYRAKMESAFTKYEYVSAENKWKAYDKSGTQYHFGSDISSRMTDHLTDPRYTFAWYLDEVTDVYGNAMKYTYEKDEDGSVYLRYIDYTSNSKCTPALTANKRIELVYVMDRPDKIYNNRTGWQTVMKRRLSEIRVSIGPDVIWSYILTYEPSVNTSRSLLAKIELTDGKETLPAKTFTYQRLD